MGNDNCISNCILVRSRNRIDYLYKLGYKPSNRLGNDHEYIFLPLNKKKTHFTLFQKVITWFNLGTYKGDCLIVLCTAWFDCDSNRMPDKGQAYAGCNFLHHHKLCLRSKTGSKRYSNTVDKLAPYRILRTVSGQLENLPNSLNILLFQNAFLHVQRCVWNHWFFDFSDSYEVSNFWFRNNNVLKHFSYVVSDAKNGAVLQAAWDYFVAN